MTDAWPIWSARTPTDEELLRSLPHRRMGWNTPLDSPHADRLLASFDLSRARRLLDLGCGWGGLLLRALARAPAATGVGVDRNPSCLGRARTDAMAAGIGDRVRFVQGDLAGVSGGGDRLICVGADHAWGGAGAALLGLRPRLHPGGLLLFGTGYWARAASGELLEMFGELPASFEALLALARSVGWTIRSADSADQREWDEFEAAWRQDLEDLAASEPDTALGRQSLRLLKQRREEYEGGYRGVVGFAYLVLS